MSKVPAQLEAVIEAEPPRFLTPAEVARMFRVSTMTVYRAIRDGDLPAVPMRGRWAVPARAIDSLESSALSDLHRDMSPHRTVQRRR